MDNEKLERATLTCLGCGKTRNLANKYENNQWLCLKCRDTEKVSVVCNDCGVEVKIAWFTFITKDKNIPWRCRACNDKYRNAVYEARSDDDKAAFIKKQTERSKAYWANLSEEERIADSNRRKKLWKQRFMTGDASHIINAMVNGRKEWYNSLTSEEKEMRWHLMDSGRAKWWDSITDAEKKLHMKHPQMGFKKWFNSIPNEERIKFMTPIWNSCKKFWNEMTPEEYQNWCIKHAISYQNHLNDVPNKVELEFIKVLDSHNILYEYQHVSEKIHPELTTKFPFNPVTGSDFINPTHRWDFMLNLSTKSILVDIDGSMHNVNNLTQVNSRTNILYHELDYRKFNDSQRPYQTDGLEAYIIECHNNVLNDDTIVCNVESTVKMPFSAFMKYIVSLNTSKEKVAVI